MPARHMSLSLGAREVGYLQAGRWEASLSYRYLYSEQFFVGTETPSEFMAAGLEPRITANTFDLSVRYGISKRFSASVTVPVVHSTASVIHPDGERRDTGPGVKLADLRAGATFWVFDPETKFDGNLGLSLGFKTPTANEMVAEPQEVE